MFFYIPVAHASASSVQVELDATGTGCGTPGCFPEGTSTPTTTPPTPPAPPAHGGGGAAPSGGGGYAAGFSFQNIKISAATSTAEISWTTNDDPTVSNISWGISSDAEEGVISEASPRMAHDIFLTGLRPATTYYVIISAVDGEGITDRNVYQFETLPVAINAPLADVTDLSAQTSFGGSVLLTWIDPQNPDFNFVRITRSDKRYPLDPEDGYIVYEGNAEQVLDTSAVAGVPYYYAAFAAYDSGTFSKGAFLAFEIGSSTGVVFENHATSGSISSHSGNGTGGTAGSSSSTSSATARITEWLEDDAVEPVFFTFYVVILWFIFYFIIRSFFD